MSELKLELLRHGESNNQLLSPLMPYLALCENEPVCSIHVPYSHAQIARILRSLSYRYDNSESAATIAEVAQAVARLLGSIPGACAQLRPNREPRQKLHFRLVLSAAELALLPFELSDVPNAISTAQAPLLLLSDMDIALTRETRRRPGRTFAPSEKPRVLFAFAEPSTPVPALAHGRALKECLQPWLAGAGAKSELRKHLTILPNATIASLMDLCSRQAFTHIHILAHGAELKNELDQRFGLAFHPREGSNATMDIVDGARLASAILSGKTRDCLQVVSLASCQGGQQGGVIGVGGSIAQALHHAGIPMVLGSQFPLSVIASVDLVRELYHGLLWGEDPRWLVCRLRGKLHAKYPETHDWGSLVHYLSTPTDLETQVLNMRVKRAIASVNCGDDEAKMALFDSTNANPLHIKAVIARTELAKQKLFDIEQDLAIEDVENRSKLVRRLASTDQLLAALHLHSDAEPKAARRTANALMKGVRERLWRAYELNRSKHWALLIYLSLESALERLGNKLPPLHGTQSIASLLTKVERFSQIEFEKGSLEKTWAYADLLELCLVRSMHCTDTQFDELKAETIKAAEALRDLLAIHPFPGFSALRQANRYRKLYPKLADTVEAGKAAFAMADRLLIEIGKILPDIDRPEYGGY